MEKRTPKKKFIWLAASLALSVLVFVALLLGGVFKRSAEQTYTPEGVFFGDSIVAIAESEEHFLTNQVAKATGMELFDAALGGTGMAYADVEGRLALTGDSMCMASLTQAIVTEDFRLQRNARIRANATEYFDDKIRALETVDFSSVSFVLIEQCLNDYHGGITIRNENPMDPYTYEGALRYVITNLKKQYPTLRIILVSPSYTWYPTEGDTCENKDYGGGTLPAYLEAQARVSEEFGLERIDLYSATKAAWVTEDRDCWAAYTKDGIHPNEEGRSFLAGLIAEYLTQ